MFSRPGPPYHKPFYLNFVTNNGEEQEWYLTFNSGPKFSTWVDYREYIEDFTKDIVKKNCMDTMFGEHQLYFFERNSIWGFYCPCIKEVEIKSLLQEWKKVWAGSDFEPAGWFRTV